MVSVARIIWLSLGTKSRGDVSLSEDGRELQDKVAGRRELDSGPTGTRRWSAWASLDEENLMLHRERSYRLARRTVQPLSLGMIRLLPNARKFFRPAVVRHDFVVGPRVALYLRHISLPCAWDIL